MGKKFGGYSWLRSADSTRRRLEYYLTNKWQRDGERLGRVSRNIIRHVWRPGQTNVSQISRLNGTDKTVTNIGITNIETNFQCKTPMWFQQIPKYA